MDSDTATLNCTVERQVEADVPVRGIAGFLKREAAKIFYDKSFDDAGCDWYTCGDHVMVAESGWHVGCDKRAAALVNAANQILYGELKTLPVESWTLKTENGHEEHPNFETREGAKAYKQEYVFGSERVVVDEGYVIGLNADGQEI